MADKTLKVYLFSSILNMLNQNGKTNLNKGYVTQIIGPVLDIKFSEGNLPIYSAIRIPLEDGTETIVEAQLGDNKVRAVSMRSTDGLKRGVEAIDLGTQLWYLLVLNIRSNFNVIGEPVDEQGDVSYDEFYQFIVTPAFTELETKPSILKLVLK
jgi:F-type H+-transporting ATPase subunit beta